MEKNRAKNGEFIGDSFSKNPLSVLLLTLRGLKHIAPAGIEPTSKVPETFVLSIERRSHDVAAATGMMMADCAALVKPGMVGSRELTE